MDPEDLVNHTNRLKKSGLLADVISDEGSIIMLTPKGYTEWEVLNFHVLTKGANFIERNKKHKSKKSGQEKMDSAIKTMTQVGAGISQLMQGLGKMGGEPVRMDMNNAGIDLGLKKNKVKKHIKRKRKGK